jgi:hypothetical protein
MLYDRHEYEIDLLRLAFEFAIDPMKQEQEEKEISALKSRFSLLLASLPGRIEDIHDLQTDIVIEIMKCVQCGHDKQEYQMHSIHTSDSSQGICKECFMFAEEE